MARQKQHWQNARGTSPGRGHTAIVATCSTWCSMIEPNPYASPKLPLEADESPPEAGRRARLLDRLRRPKDVPLWVLALALALLYWAGAPIAMRFSIRWPAPYWYAFGLSGLAISMGIGDAWRHVVLGTILGTLGGVALWYAQIGAYHVQGVSWAYQGPWPYLLRIPAYLLVASIFVVTRKASHFSWSESLALAAFYLTVYLSLIGVAPIVCSIALPRSGTFIHGNYTVFGYRLGAFAVCAAFLCVACARGFAAWMRSRETRRSSGA